MEEETEESYLFPVKGNLGFQIRRGKGSFLYTTDGRRLLDLYTGHGVALLGHGDPEFLNALQNQISELVFVSTLAESEQRETAGRLLAESSGPGYSRVFFNNSGAEANEAAMKIARKATGRRGIVAFQGGFHGRTYAAVAACGIPSYRDKCHDDPAFTILPWDDADAVEANDYSNTAAILFEPIQGLAGVREARPAFYEALRDVSQRYGVLLIADEVQSGLGRTGRFLTCDHFGLKPHLVTFAKGLGNGIPVAAVVAREDIAKTVAPGDLGSTFGGGPVAMAAAVFTLEAIRDRRLLEHVAKTGAHLRQPLEKIEEVTEVRGKGLFLAFHTPYPSSAVRNALLDEGVWVGLSEEAGVLRLLPPLTISKEESDLFIESLEAALAAVKKQGAIAGAGKPSAQEAGGRGGRRA